jgi:hypothetical protein
MDQPNLQNANSNRAAQPPPTKTDEKPIPFDGLEAKPAAVSRQPLSLGGPGGTAAPAPRPASPAPAPAPATRPAAPVAVAAPRPAAVAKPTPLPGAVNHSGERITGMKTFFAKLHIGALGFLEEQIQGWLKDNPGITIKATNVTTGEVQAKVTEPNLIVVVWY